MRKTFIMIFLLITIIASLAIARYDLDGTVTVTQVYVHTAGGDYKLDISEICLNLFSRIGIEVLWKELCLGAEKYGCVLCPFDKVIVFFKDETGLESAAVVAADKDRFAQEFLNGVPTYLTL